MNTVDIAYLIISFGMNINCIWVHSNWKIAWCKINLIKLLDIVCRKGNVKIIEYLFNVGINIKEFRHSDNIFFGNDM